MMLSYRQEDLIFQESIRRFSERELLPHINRWEADKFFPNEVFEKLGRSGFLGILIEERWGGVGGDYLMAGAWCEEFGKVPAHGLTVAVNMHSLVITPTVERFASDVVKEKFLKKAVEGQSIGAYAFTEPNAGSDLTAIQTRAHEDGDSYILNGSKIFITNGKRAEFVLVLARTDANAGYGGYTTFVVESEFPGFQVNRTLDKLGWHCSDTAELSFVDVRVPKTHVLGEVGKGWYQAMSSLQWERVMLTLNALGGAEKCLFDTVRYVNDRRVFQQPLALFDHTRTTLTTLYSRLRAAQSYARETLQKLQRGERCRRESALGKLVGCELAVEIADRCLQLHGGYGYTTEFLPERWLRDLRLNPIGGGTSEIMARIAAGEFISAANSGTQNTAS